MLRFLITLNVHTGYEGPELTLPAGMHFSLEFTKESSEYTHGKDKLGTRRTEKNHLIAPGVKSRMYISHNMTCTIPRCIYSRPTKWMFFVFEIDPH